PYAGGGGIVGQTLSGTTESRATFFNTARTDRTYSQFRSSDNQFPAYIANAGVEWNRYRVVIRPEVRYTRWGNTKTEPRRTAGSSRVTDWILSALSYVYQSFWPLY